MTMSKQEVILGLLKVTVDGVNLGYSRGANRFTVSRVFHAIKANGDMGDTVNTEILDEERATLNINQLTMTPDEFVKIFPAAANSSGTLTPTGAVNDLTDYHTVVALAKTKEGKTVTITLNNAFCKSNIDWQFNERDEVVSNVQFEACYAVQSDLWDYTAPYSIVFANAG